MTLKMTADRTLIITKRSNTYQDKNNAEMLKIILPKVLNSIDLKDCYIYLSFINQQNLGNICDLTEYIADYNDDYYVVEVPIYQMLTHESGTVRMWVEVLHTPTEMVAKTNEVSFTVQVYSEIEGTIPQQEMSIIDGLVTKLDTAAIQVDEVSGKVEEIDDYVKELQRGEVLLVQPMLTAKIQDDEGDE